VVEHLFKILVVGDIGTGKTSIIKRYVHNIFSMSYKSTVVYSQIKLILKIGVEFALKVINWDPKTEIRLQLWDIAGIVKRKPTNSEGQERFGNMTRVFFSFLLNNFERFTIKRLLEHLLFSM
jgi:Ras-related protein Rab-32